MTPSQQAFVLLLSVVFLSGKENIQNALIRPENKLVPVLHIDRCFPLFVYNKTDIIVVSSKVTCSRNDIADKILTWR
jgi:hypothetical protein